MIGDSSLNTLCNGGIYYDNLPVNFNLNNDWIVYNYKDKESIDVLIAKNVMTIYTLYVKVVSTSTENLLKITDEVNTYLTHYTSSNISDIQYITDNHQNTIVEDNDVFENTIEYDVYYVS
jgi:hypothetical protein